MYNEDVPKNTMICDIRESYTDNFVDFPFLKDYYETLGINPMHIPVLIGDTRTVVDKVNTISRSYGIMHTPLVELNKGINYCDDDSVAKEVLSSGKSENVENLSRIYINSDLIDTQEEFEEIMIHEVSHSIANRYWAMTREDQEDFEDDVIYSLDTDPTFVEKYKGEKQVLLSMFFSGFAIREIAACYFAMKYNLLKYGKDKLLEKSEGDPNWAVLHSENTFIERYNAEICNCLAVEILLAEDVTLENERNDLQTLENIIHSPQTRKEILQVSSILARRPAHQVLL